MKRVFVASVGLLALTAAMGTVAGAADRAATRRR